MTRSGRVVGVCAALSAGLLLSGCMNQEPLTRLSESSDKPFVLNVPQAEMPTTTARFQRADLPGGPPVANTVPSTVRVCALVNGKIIFQDEVWNIMGGPQQIKQMPPAQQQAAFSKALDDIIDSELLMQDALVYLDKLNPEAVKSIKKKAYAEFEKNIATTMRNQGISSKEEFNRVLMEMQGTTVESIKRHMERDFIGNGFLSNKIEAKLKSVGNQEILDYYNNHLNQYMKVDSVKWQDLFIAVGPKHPTMADAKQFANHIGQRWATGEDIAKLLDFDDGQGAVNKGAGVGENRGDIRPSELEPYLFAMKDGEFGPLVELSTGVHVFRLIKREYAGPMPFDEKTQTSIGNLLKNEIFRQERQRAVTKLRERASIQIIHDQ